MFYFAWLSLGLDYRPARRGRTSQGQAGLGLSQSGNRPEGRLSQSRGWSQQGNHHRDETEMAFPGRTRLSSPPLEPAGERARPAATLSKGHRAEMELWRNKKALDLRGHRTTPHRSGERRGYRSETESPCDQVNQPASDSERAPCTSTQERVLAFRGDVSVLGGQICQSKGLVSIDRSEAAALLSTTPRLRTRSSTNDFAPLRCMGWVSCRPDLRAGPRRPIAVSLWLCHRGRRNAVGPRISLPPGVEALNGIVALLGRILT